MAKVSLPSGVPGGGWGWVVTFACCVNTMLTVSLMNTFGLYYTYILDEFEEDLTEIAFIGSTNTAIYLAGGMLVVPVVEKVGERPVLMFGGLLQSVGCLLSVFATSFPLLFLGLAVVNGLGCSLSYVTTLMSINRYFHRNRSIAMALASAGGSIAVIIFPIIANTLLTNYGLHGALLVNSGILLNSIVAGVVVFPSKSEDIKPELKTNLQTPKLDMSFCKNRNYVAYLITNFLFMIGYYIPSGLLPETALAAGLTLDEISFTFTLSGVLNFVGRLVFAGISHKHNHHITKLWIINLIGMGLSMLIVPFSNNFTHFLAFNMLNGFCLGGNNLGYNLALKNIIDLKYYGRGISFALLVQGIGSLVGNPFAAFLQESLGNNGIPYYMGALILIVSGLVLLPFSKERKEAIMEPDATIITYM